MPLHVDPRKHELLEARIQGTNHIRSTNNVPRSTKSNSYASGYMFPITEEPSGTPEHSVLRGSSSPFSSVGEHDLSTSSSEIKPVSTVVPSISVEINERIPSATDPGKRLHNPNCHNIHRLEVTSPGLNVQDSQIYVQTQEDYVTSPTTPKKKRIPSSSVGESDNTSNDGLITSLVKSDDKLIEALAPGIPANPLGSPQGLQYVSRSNSIHTPTTVAGNSPVKQPYTFVEEKNAPYPTFQISVQPSAAFIETNNPTYHLSPSIGPHTPTPGGQGHTPKPKKMVCQERGSKRIDEIFKFMPGPLYSSCGSTSPTQNPRLQSPSPTGAHSLDNQMVGVNHNYIPSLNEAVTTSCASNDQMIITSVTGIQYANNAATFQLSPVRASSTASLSDSSGDNPVSMVGLITTGGPASSVPLTSVESLQRRIADLEHETVVQRETITKLQDNAIRSREMIRELLIEKVSYLIIFLNILSDCNAHNNI
ncbi:unnamed protein product [Schistosoma curassoni]|uniref:Miff domain-containing protein n=1 Tax=Schistosoma curassoni TaxID=6186 RepID=A0A183KPD8_9TREM|nr:unnamed protein product [Schistosoma curassoni]